MCSKTWFIITYIKGNRYTSKGNITWHWNSCHLKELVLRFALSKSKFLPLRAAPISERQLPVCKINLFAKLLNRKKLTLKIWGFSKSETSAVRLISSSTWSSSGFYNENNRLVLSFLKTAVPHSMLLLNVCILLTLKAPSKIVALFESISGTSECLIK